MLIPDDLQGEEDIVLAKIRAGEKVDHYETVRQRKDGSRLSISLTVSPIRDDAGAIVGASKIARDVTERVAPAGGRPTSTRPIPRSSARSAPGRVDARSRNRSSRRSPTPPPS